MRATCGCRRRSRAEHPDASRARRAKPSISSGTWRRLKMRADEEDTIGSGRALGCGRGSSSVAACDCRDRSRSIFDASMPRCVDDLALRELRNRDDARRARARASATASGAARPRASRTTRGARRTTRRGWRPPSARRRRAGRVARREQDVGARPSRDQSRQRPSAPTQRSPARRRRRRHRAHSRMNSCASRLGQLVPCRRSSARIAADAGRLAAQLARVDGDPHSSRAPVAVAHGVGIGAAQRGADSSQVNACARSRPALRARRAPIALVASTRSIAAASAADVVGIDERAGVADDFRQRAALRRDDRHAGRHRLERRQPEALVERGQHEHARGRDTAPRARRRRRSRGASRGRRAAAPRCAPASRRAAGGRAPASTSGGTCACRSSSARRRRAARRRSCVARACRRTGCIRRRHVRRTAERAPRRRAGRADVDAIGRRRRAARRPARLPYCVDVMTASARRAWRGTSAG